jgi:hypothetical protein
MLIRKLIKYEINTNRLFVVIVVAVALVMMSATIRSFTQQAADDHLRIKCKLL